jgi:hypothetical protein
LSLPNKIKPQDIIKIKSTYKKLNLLKNNLKTLRIILLLVGNSILVALKIYVRHGLEQKPSVNKWMLIKLNLPNL